MNSSFSTTRTNELRRITISDLLNHTGGWSRYKGDPMFNSLYIARKMHSADPPADLDLDHSVCSYKALVL